MVLVLDLVSKQLIFDFLGVDPGAFATITEFNRSAPRASEHLVGADGAGFQVKLVAMLNPGMMWGAFGDYPTVLKVVRPLAVLVIFLLLAGLPAEQRFSRIALGGILGGAIGNIYDSFVFPGVRDYFEVRIEGVPLCEPFPAFNVADAAICVGVAFLALGMMRGRLDAAGGHAPPA